MPSRPDIRDLATNVREAFADADRDTLLDVLTFVVKEYVVEGPPPMLVHQAETLSDLQGASFAQLVSALQTRFDHPELAMFVVDGEQVSVRVGGVVQPLLPQRQPLAPASESPRPAAGVRVVETTLSQRPPPAAPAPATPPQRAEGAAPPPVRGISLSGRPTSGGGAPTPPREAAPPTPPTSASSPPAAAPAAQPEAKPEKPSDDVGRASLLELD